eukprot:TRINITY_DN1386_c0_g1_i3.p1 TRINITY_DN1386_c0_g1~~TRINITY_DN1386_c0_g1_i3.p1  ORF type:complete len:115 (-),score=24.04 TRINITY_DN1386_c0_g1_i3:44-355(-)
MCIRVRYVVFQAMKKVLISGVSGFLGSQTLKLCLANGYKVKGTVRDLAQKEKIDYLSDIKSNKDNLEIVEASLSNPHHWLKEINGCDHVIHHAAPLRLSLIHI